MWFSKIKHLDASFRQKPIILLVDDDIQEVTMMRSNLEHEGYQVEFATDGISGKQKAWDVHPDLIIADIFMPGVNGFSMMEAIQERTEMVKIPVIFLSGKASADILPKFDSSARKYALMKKPVFLPELNQLIRQFLS